MKAPIQSSKPCFPPKEIDWILQEIRTVLESGSLTVGTQVKQFEKKFAEYIGVRHAICVSDGTVSLEIILRYYDVKGWEVIVPTNTFIASQNAVILAGGRPVFADMHESSLCAGLKEIKRQHTNQTKGVMLVHIAGFISPEIDEIRAYCKKHSLFLIEDAAHAHGATWKGQKTGSLADAASFSFFPTKVMTTGEGGMITTNQEALAEFAKLFRNHGAKEGGTTHDVFGYNSQMDEVRGVLGRSQLRILDAMLAKRREIAKQYKTGLKLVKGLELIRLPKGMDASFYKFPILVSTVERRKALSEALQKHGIKSGSVYWPPCHLQPVVLARPELYGVRGPYPVSEDILPRILCLPMHPQLDTMTVNQIISAVKTENKKLR
ncbi:MAG: DegT/DnrJ/EryC1/StrS family aminotransferase [Nitrospirota bacterium]